MLFALAADDHQLVVSDTLQLIDRLNRQAAAAPDAAARNNLLREADGLRPSTAVLLARQGRGREANAIIARLPMTNDGVLRALAFVTALNRDPAADRLFAAAVARTPSLPAAPLLWAEALVRTGRYGDAERQAREALRRGPRCAEAQRWLGEALIGQRKVADAERAFAMAANLQPWWGSLHMRWAAALWRLGKRDEARAKLRAAATMALSEADRAHWRTMWSNARAA